MASDDAVQQTVLEKSNEYESRGMFDFMKKDDSNDEGKVIAVPEFDDKVHVSESEPNFEECKIETTEEETKPTLLDKLHRSNGSSSSASDGEVEEGGEKKKKGLKEKIKEKIHKDEDTSVPVEVVAEQEEKKGLLEKIKDKLPGNEAKKVEDEAAPAAEVDCTTVEGEPEKKGILEKIKEKMPGHHPKASTAEDKDCA